MHQRTITMIILICIVFLLSCEKQPQPPAGRTISPQQVVPAKQNVRKKAVPPLAIRNFQLGMTMSMVKQLLQREKVVDYQTAFSDLFVYDPSPVTEVKLQFICGALGTVELRTDFAADEAEDALSKFEKRLAAKYGRPSIADSQKDRLDLCWGHCGGSAGAKLTAKTAESPEGEGGLVLSLVNEGKIRECKDERRKKINAWLYQWIAAVQKFEPDVSLANASELYRARYRDQMLFEEERDTNSPRFAVDNYVVKAYDFFPGLDYESLMFEGQGPGVIILKFTGDQAGQGNLNRRLYYSSFSTTAFNDVSLGADLPKKLALFIKAYGKPSAFSERPGKVLASWENGLVFRKLEIDDSGFMAFEQGDYTLRDAYREAAVDSLQAVSKAEN